MIGRGGSNESIWLFDRRHVPSDFGQRRSDATGSVGVTKLEGDGQLCEAGADRVSRFQRGGEREARRQAEGVPECQRPPAAGAARAAAGPLTRDISRGLSPTRRPSTARRARAAKRRLLVCRE